MSDQQFAAALHEEEDGYLKGVATILGASHHVELVRVRDEPDPDDPAATVQAADGGADLAERYTAMQAYYDGAYETCTVPGHPGDWVLFIIPFAR